MLDRAVSFAHGQRDVVDGHVGMEIDEALGVSPVPGHPPKRAERFLGRRCRGGESRTALLRMPGLAGRLDACGESLGQAVVEPERAVRRADDAHRLSRRARNEAGAGLVEAEPPARLGIEMHRGVPSARHADQVAADAPRRAFQRVP